MELVMSQESSKESISKQIINIHHLNIPAIILDTDYTVQEINILAAQLHGADQQIMLGQHYQTFCQTNKLKPAFAEQETDKLTPQDTITAVVPYEQHEVLRHIEWTTSGLCSATDQHSGFLLLGKDVTQEHDLQSQNASLSLEVIINHIPAPIYWMDKDCIYQGCNDYSAKLAGLKSRHEIKGKTYTDFVKNASMDEVQTESFLRDDLWVIKHNQAKLNIEEEPMLGPDGKMVYYLNNRVPLHDKAGNVIGVAGFGLDITDRKRVEKLAQEKKLAEQAIVTLKAVIEKFTGDSELDLEDAQSYVKELDSYFQKIICELPGLIYWKDRNGLYLGCNKNVLNLFSVQDVNEVIGRTDYELFEHLGWAKNVPEKIIRDDEYVMDTGEPSLNQEEPPFITADGNEIFQLSNRIPLKNSEGKVIGILGNTFDITDRKRAEKLETQNQVAEETIARLKTIAGSIAHELKNPLAGIKTRLNVIQIVLKKFLSFYQDALDAKIVEPSEEKTPPEKIADYVDMANKRVDYASGYISMQLANMSQDHIDTSQFTQCSITEVVQEALDNYSFDDISLESSVHWQGGKDFTFHGSQRFTVNIIWNLLSNALHYVKTEHKGEVTLWLDSDEQYNYLHCKDTAKGMTPEMAAQVFEQFFSKRTLGTGLGLSFCQMLMQAYGGDISCTAEEGKYAQFTLRFPR